MVRFSGVPDSSNAMQTRCYKSRVSARKQDTLIMVRPSRTSTLRTEPGRQGVRFLRTVRSGLPPAVRAGPLRPVRTFPLAVCTVLSDPSGPLRPFQACALAVCVSLMRPGPFTPPTVRTGPLRPDPVLSAGSLHRYYAARNVHSANYTRRSSAARPVLCDSFPSCALSLCGPVGSFPLRSAPVLCGPERSLRQLYAPVFCGPSGSLRPFPSCALSLSGPRPPG